MRTSRTLALLLAAGLAGTSLAPLNAAKTLGAPSKYLRQEPQVVAILAAEEVLPEGERVRFRRLEVLFGEVPEERVSVRVPAGTLADVETGGVYIVGLSYVRPVPRGPRVFEIDPEGPGVVSVPGAGLALYQDTPDLRLLLGPAADDEAGRKQRLAALLAQLGRSDERAATFCATELMFSEDLFEFFDPTAVETLAARLASDAVSLMAKQYLFEVARQLAERQGGAWLAPIARQMLEETGTELDLASFVPAVTLAAAEALEVTGRPADLPVLAKHLRSNAPGVVKAALSAMETLDAQGTFAYVEEAAEIDELPLENHRVFRDYFLRKAKEDAGRPAGTATAPASLREDTSGS